MLRRAQKIGNGVAILGIGYFLTHVFLTSTHEAQLTKVKTDTTNAKSQTNMRLVLEKYASKGIIKFKTVSNPPPINTTQFIVESRSSWLFGLELYKFEIVCNSDTECNFGSIQTITEPAIP
jgi:hypothetical protein